MNLKTETILFFAVAADVLFLAVFTEWLNDSISIGVLVIMIIWMNRIIKKRNKPE